MGFLRLACFAAALLLPGLANAEYLTKRDIQEIKKHWPDYAYAAEKTGVPVAALPAIHYRESGLYAGYYSWRRRSVTKNIGGPFMLDLGGEGEEFGRRIRDYEVKVYRKLIGRGEVPRVSHNFRFAALVAAYELKTKLRSDRCTYPALADAVWGYNGRSARCSLAENSYVWNDPKRGKYLTVTVKRQGELITFVDQRPGVMVIYGEVLKLQREGKL